MTFWPAILFAAEICPNNEKKLHVGEACIPTPLYNYFRCIEKSGKGNINITSVKKDNNIDRIEIRLENKEPIFVINKESGKEYPVPETKKVMEDIHQILDPSVASRCQILFDRLEKIKPKKTFADLENENGELKLKIIKLNEQLDKCKCTIK
jgi:hypothetical protein